MTDPVVPDWIPDWAAPIVLGVGVVGYVAKSDVVRRAAAATADAAKWGVLQFRSYETRREADRVLANRELSIGLADIRRRSGANRVNCILMHNGGGDIFDEKNPKYLSVWDTADEDVSIDSRAAWPKEKLHPAYRNEVLKPLVDRAGLVLDLHTVDLSHENPLHDYYRRDDITFATVCEAGSDENGFWYVSLNYKDVSPPGQDPILCISRAREAARQAASLVRRLKPRLR